MNRKTRILRELQRGPRTTAELCQPDVGGVRFGARLMELRADGYTITEERLGQSCHLYTLAGVPAPTRRASLRCGYGHEWDGTCRRCAQGYPLVWSAEPSCPICGRDAMSVEAYVGPARPEVIERAAA